MKMFFAGRLSNKTRDAYSRDTVSGMLSGVMCGSIFPFIAVIARDQLKASEFQMAVLTMAPTAANLLSLLWANIMEGRRKMPYAFWAWIGSRLLFLLVLFTNTSTSFVLIISLFWIIASITGPAYSALLKEIYSDEDRAMAMAYARVCTLCVMSLVSLFCGFLLKIVSFHYVFPIAGIFGIASAWAFNSIPTKQTTGDSSVSLGQFLLNSVQILIDDRGFRWLCAGVFISGFANLMLGPIIAIYQVDVLHVRTQWAGVYAVITQGTQMVGYVYWGSYIDKSSSTKAVAITSLLLSLMPLAYCVSSQAWMLLPIMVLVGVLNAGSELSYFNSVLDYAPHDRISQYQAVFASLLGLRGIVAPFLGVLLVGSHFGGLIQTQLVSMRLIFIIAAVMMIASYFVQMVGVHKYDKPMETST